MQKTEQNGGGKETGDETTQTDDTAKASKSRRILAGRYELACEATRSSRYSAGFMKQNFKTEFQSRISKQDFKAEFRRR